ncbi:MAG TPA: SipW-dependent-type signal peptide-containing protein [Firmicutes bacterium]|nr:SipW-dependent-type signal peptide-containing protein [Bacillota bacterium]
MGSTKKSLLASGLALCASAALLMGSTFAWFTDSVTNTGNRIQAGSLNLNVIGYRLENGQWSNPIWQTQLENGALFEETTWEPGQYGAVLLKVSNYSSSVFAKVDVDFSVTENTGELADALWYKLTAVHTVAASNEQAMLDSLSFKDSRPASEADGVTTMSKIEDDATEEMTLAPNQNYQDGQYGWYMLEYGMYTSAGNEYQDGSFALDFTVKATQAPVEEDGFGDSTYDENAGYPVNATVSDAGSLEDALQNPGVPADITLDQAISGKDSLNVTGNATLNMGANSVYYITPVAAAKVTVAAGASLTINAEAQSGLNYNLGRLTADGGTLTVNGGKYGESGSQRAEVSAINGGTVIINDGSFSSSGMGGHAVTASAGGTVTINGGSVSSSGRDSVVLYADGGTIVVENVSFGGINGDAYGAANGGQILVSKTYSPSQPTRVADGCTVTDNGDGYWLIAEA